MKIPHEVPPRDIHTHTFTYTFTYMYPHTYTLTLHTLYTQRSTYIVGMYTHIDMPTLTHTIYTFNT